MLILIKQYRIVVKYNTYVTHSYLIEDFLCKLPSSSSKFSNSAFFSLVLKTKGKYIISQHHAKTNNFFNRNVSKCYKLSS
jgi:hypothetical protein